MIGSFATNTEFPSHIDLADFDFPRVIVVQTGARHNYAIPRILEYANMLEALYTDSTAHSLLGRMAGWIPSAWRPASAQRLSQRQVVGVPQEKVFSTDTLWIAQQRLRLQGVQSSQSIFRAYNTALSQRALTWGVRNADIIYSMFGEATDFLREASGRGCLIAIDVFISPIARLIVADEAARYPEWASADDTISDKDMCEAKERIERLFSLADILTCPSEHVIKGCRNYASFEQEKAWLVPYSAGFNFENRINQPEVGRVLFVGKASLRKGIHYLAFAAEELTRRGRCYKYIVSGGVTPSIRNHPQARHLNFVGWLLRPALHEEYLKADVMVFPSLSEGSASVVYEAMAAGLPVITTPAAGSVITHNVDGVLVPERDPKALADAIEALIEDRERRDQIAAAALETARRQGEDVWRRRLVEVLSLRWRDRSQGCKP